MAQQPSLFDDEPHVPTASAVVHHALQSAHTKVTAAQRKFRQLLDQRQRLRQEIDVTRAVLGTNRQQWALDLTPLERERDELQCQMALRLHRRLQGKGLTRHQRQTATEIACNLAAAQAEQGNADMRALHDALSDCSLAEMERQQVAALQGLIEEAMGQKLESHAGAPFEDLGALLHAARLRLEADRTQNDDPLGAMPGVRARLASKKRSKVQIQKEERRASLEQDADSALRTLYRQLASALHPDRASDAEERARKTDWMKEANTAYAARDLLALLQLQWRTDLADSAALETMAKEKLAALTHLLDERVQALRAELRGLQREGAELFDVPLNAVGNAEAMDYYRKRAQRNLRAALTSLRHDLTLVDDDAPFKRWLKEQRAEMLAEDYPF